MSTPLHPLPLQPTPPPTHLSQPPPTTTVQSSAVDVTTAAQFYTLGLDINTQSIGYFLLTPSLHTLRHGLITLSHLPPSSTPATRLTHITEQLTVLLSALPPAAQLHTAVESYLLSFTAQRFQTRSLFQLASFNSLVQCQLWQLTGRGEWPAVVNVRSARSRFGLKGEVREGKAGRRVSDVKGVVWRWVDERLRRESSGGAAEVEWRRKRDGSVHDTMYDISDAYLIALTAAIERQQQQQTEANGSVVEEEGLDRAVSASKVRVRKARSTVVNSSSNSTGSGVGDESRQTQKSRRRRIVASE